MRGKKEGKVTLAVIAALMFISLIAVTAGTPVTTVSIGDASASYSNTTTIPIMINVSSADAPAGLGAAMINLTYDPNVCVVTSVVKGPSSFDSFTSSHPYTNISGYVRIVAYQAGVTGVGPGLVKFADIKLKAIGNTGVSGLNLIVETLKNNTGTEVPYNTKNGSFTILAEIFDTGSPANPYPSIMGNHTGIIKPNHTVIATKLYTYPCPGTGGHTEYARIWNATWNATATWEGYAGDWHNITFDKTVILLANENYNYTIKTGSYSQIHHTNALLIANGWINCTKFTDAKGEIYTDWIPAIRLW